MTTEKEIVKVLEILKQSKGQTMLEEYQHLPAFQLLIMTLLSARTKDSTVIPIALNLFKDNPTPEKILEIPEADLANKIRKIGFHNSKSKHILQLCDQLITNFNGKVPNTLEELTSLPGVGRKTANCILSYVFNIPAIAVDVHVFVITNRLNWVNTKNTQKTELKLMKIIPKDNWIDINKILVDHGQRVCGSPKPKCHLCSITKFCQYPK